MAEKKQCSSCDSPSYAKGYCKKCYMRVNRAAFSAPKAGFDPEDFWQFVKAELNIG